MSELDNLSEEQLVKLISAKKMGGDNSKGKDYSQQYKRNIGDTLRDVAYGAIHGPWEAGKLGGNILTGGNLEKLPGYKQYIPFMEKMIESVKSPYASPAGDIAQTVGEFAPAVLGGAAEARAIPAVRAAIRRIPSITRRGMERPYAEALRTAAEEGVGGLAHPPELAQQTEQFLQSQNVPMGTRLERALSGEYGGGIDVKNTLGQLSRSLPFNSGERIGAQNLRADWMNSLLRELERGGFHRTHQATRHAEEHYARSARLREALGALARHGSGLTTLRGLLGMARHI